MSEFVSYEDYVADDPTLQKYANYQDRYAENMRESDKVLLRMVGERLSTRPRNAPPMRVLDIGCSTGNLLKHFKHHFPALELVGGDLANAFVEGCRKNPALKGMQFEVMDILDLPHAQPFDVIIANAVAVYFSQDEYRQALASVARALRPGGMYLAFEWLHEFQQDLEIIETSRSQPGGLKIHFRPIGQVQRWIGEAGFSGSDFFPFEIPIDLERNATFAGNQEGFEDLNSYTRMTDDGHRLLFRGALHQPWCHPRATKAA